MRSGYLINILLAVFYLLVGLSYLFTRNSIPWWLGAFLFLAVAFDCAVAAHGQHKEAQAQYHAQQGEED